MAIRSDDVGEQQVAGVLPLGDVLEEGVDGRGGQGVLQGGAGHDGDRGLLGEPLEDVAQDHGCRLPGDAVTPWKTTAYQKVLPPIQGWVRCADAIPWSFTDNDENTSAQRTHGRPAPWLCFLFWSSLRSLTAASSPLRLHPENPHYFLFRGKPAVLVTSGEHYGAVLNLDFDHRPYLDELQRHGLNLTRTFSGTYREVPGSFKIRDNTLAPRPGRFSCPWARQGDEVRPRPVRRRPLPPPPRLRLRGRPAGDRRRVRPLLPALRGGALGRQPDEREEQRQRGRPHARATRCYTLKHDDLLERQLAFVRKAVTELNGFDNVYFEICNEPYFGGVTLDWQAQDRRDDRRDREGPAQQAPDRPEHRQRQGRGSRTPTRTSRSSTSTTPRRPTPSRSTRRLNRPIAFDETGFKGTADRVYRRQAWEFLMAGGAVFSNLDYSFTPEHEDGTAKVEDPTPGGGGPALRTQLGILKRFVEGFDLVHIRPDTGFLKASTPPGSGGRSTAWPIAGRAITPCTSRRDRAFPHPRSAPRPLPGPLDRPAGWQDVEG